MQHEDDILLGHSQLGPLSRMAPHMMSDLCSSHQSDTTQTVQQLYNCGVSISVLTGTKSPHLRVICRPRSISSGVTTDFFRTRSSPSTSIVRSCRFLGRCPLCLARPSSMAERLGRDTVHALHTTLMAASHTAHSDITRVPVQVRFRPAIAHWSRRFHQSPTRRGRQQTT